MLGGREAVRRRPGMYIGSTDQRGMHHLVYEIVHNSVDEAMAGFCTKIKITIDKNNVVTVEDNGRGIPVDIHPTTKVSALETVLTVLHAGAKFGGKTYQVSGGLRRQLISGQCLIGRMEATVRMNGKIYYQEYRKGIPQEELRKLARLRKRDETISFWQIEIFTDEGYDFDTLNDRFRRIAYLNKVPEISFTMRNRP